MYIDGKWYSKSEIIAKFHEMQKEIKRLKEENQLYLETIQRKSESEDCD